MYKLMNLKHPQRRFYIIPQGKATVSFSVNVLYCFKFARSYTGESAKWLTNRYKAHDTTRRKYVNSLGQRQKNSGHETSPFLNTLKRTLSNVT